MIKRFFVARKQMHRISICINQGTEAIEFDFVNPIVTRRRRALERCMARLEGGQTAFVFTTGMAAIDALFRLLRPDIAPPTHSLEVPGLFNDSNGQLA